MSDAFHLDRLAEYKESKRNGTLISDNPDIHGCEWGDVERVPPLRFIKDTFIVPYVNPAHTALEIGVGGGRWTRYLVGFGHIYAVDCFREMLDELAHNLPAQQAVSYIKNDGRGLPGVPENSVDYVFSFGTFVHFEPDLIDAYLAALRPVLKPGANVVLQYSDYNKVMARNPDYAPHFSKNTPEAMREQARAQGYRILEEDTTSLWHSSVIRISP